MKHGSNARAQAGQNTQANSSEEECGEKNPFEEAQELEEMLREHGVTFENEAQMFDQADKMLKCYKDTHVRNITSKCIRKIKDSVFRNHLSDEDRVSMKVAVMHLMMIGAPKAREEASESKHTRRLDPSRCAPAWPRRFPPRGPQSSP